MTSELLINEYKLIIQPVSPLAPKAVEMQYKKANPEPLQPTYTVEAVAGIVETFKHDKTTISTAEELIAFETWEIKHNEWMSGLTYKLLRLFLSQGVKLALTKEQETDLLGQTAMLEIDLPTNKSERDLFLLETYILSSPALMEKVIQAVLEETGIKEASIEAANALFPS